MAEKFKIEKRIKLLEFLFSHLEGWSKKTIKQRLKNESILVNGKVNTKHDFYLQVKDIVEIAGKQKGFSSNRDKIEIIYQDKDLIAINKPAGLLSVATKQENKVHALAILRKQLSHSKKDVKLWPVHRLDRDTSGILLFATSKIIRETLMATWGEAQKVYLAVVEGKPVEKKATINQALRLDEKEYRMHVGQHPDAKMAISHYELKKEGRQRSLLEVRIETGRQHQIRAHMAWLGHSITGDERYGTKGSRMGLHATKLKIIHPVTKAYLELEVAATKDFYQLLEDTY
ncbi:MAG: RluA family pseudouridine synthase [Epsilonproteobacteria bacterium]|nr:MAG: RluA family pseudouridine synthase [Campylobacterota bacterium]